jgi:hypothetical protein
VFLERVPLRYRLSWTFQHLEPVVSPEAYVFRPQSTAPHHLIAPYSVKRKIKTLYTSFTALLKITCSANGDTITQEKLARTCFCANARVKTLAQINSSAL